MSKVELINISKNYGSVEAVRDLSLTIEDGEFFSLLGPSGCGKSTLLRMLAGFIRPSHGEIRLGGRNVVREPPEKRNVGIVFQNYAIFPHMTVFDNIAFGLRMRKVPKKDIAGRVEAVIDRVGLGGHEGRYQRELSGGQQQRVAVARVLVTEPGVLLLDEPLSALDKRMRDEMRVWIRDIHDSLGITTIYVTHDQAEALTMSDRIAVMFEGQSRQVASPRRLYEDPVDEFVARFVGESTLLEGEVVRVEGPRAWVRVAAGTVVASRDESLGIGEGVYVMVRPEHVEVRQEGEAVLDGAAEEEGRLAGRVAETVFEGPRLRYGIDVRGGSISSEAPVEYEEVVHGDPVEGDRGRPLRPGAEVMVSWDWRYARLLSGPAREAPAGEMTRGGQSEAVGAAK